MPKKYSIVVPKTGKFAPIDELFLFETGNWRFLVGEDQYIWGTGSYTRALTLPTLLAVATLLLGLTQPGVMLQAILVALVFLILGLAACWRPCRNRQLRQQGKLIQGRIITFDGYRAQVGAVPFFCIRVVRYGWEVNALCGFRNPEGKAMSGRIRIIRNDLANRDIAEGTPVLILYRNDYHYKVL
jgi:hypothetical protein